MPEQETESERAFRARLQQLVRDLGGATAAAALTDKSVKQISRYLTGESEPPWTFVSIIAERAGRPIEWLATGREPSDPAPARAVATEQDEVLVPLYDVAVAAGSGRLIDDAFVVEHIPLPRHTVAEAGGNPGTLVAFRAEGQSMNPTIRHGEIIICDMSKNNVRSDLVYAFRMSGEMRVKRFRLGVRHLLAFSDNRDFDPEMLDVKEIEDFEVIGQVLLVYGRHVA